jgi:hypothetical protein
MLKFFKKGISAPLAIGIIFILAFFVGALTRWQYLKMEEDIVFTSSLKPREKIKESKTKEELIDELINQVFSEDYDRENVETFLVDLNNDNSEEIILSATSIVTQGGLAKRALIVVVEFSEQLANFEQIAQFSFNEEDSIFFRQTPNINSQNSILDIDQDGIKEMVFDLGTGGASNEAYGIFKVDWDPKNMEWLKVTREDGTTENSYLLKGGSAMHQETFQLIDVDSDGFIEIVEWKGRYLGEGDWQKEESWEWQVWTYKWDGFVFNYDEELSELLSEGGRI